jgi:hypothetical protein
MRGSVLKRGRTWTYVLSLGREPGSGKKRQRWVGGFNTKADAETPRGSQGSRREDYRRRAEGLRTDHRRPSKAVRVEVDQKAWQALKVEAVKSHASMPRLLGQLVIADLATGDCHCAGRHRDEPRWRRTGQGRRARQYARIEVDDETWSVLRVNAAERRRTFDGRIQLLEYVPTILAGPPGTNTVNA